MQFQINFCKKLNFHAKVVADRISLIGKAKELLRCSVFMFRYWILYHVKSTIKDNYIFFVYFPKNSYCFHLYPHKIIQHKNQPILSFSALEEKYLFVGTAPVIAGYCVTWVCSCVSPCVVTCAAGHLLV